MTEELGITREEELEKLFHLQCPSCGGGTVKVRNSHGVAGEIFVEVLCRSCGEKGFFQLIGVENDVLEIERAENPWAELDRVLQKDWNDWHDYKTRHLKPTPVTGGSWFKPANVFFLIMIVGGWSFFFIDQIHLLDGIFENIQIRKAHIQDYTAKLGKLPCLSRAMKEKLKNVPIRYTRERPYHRDRIQYGEAGIYWGEEQIKVHRSNFWFFGAPRESQLVETLIHEVRHRVSPALGHNELFYELVERDTKCSLKLW